MLGRDRLRTLMLVAILVVAAYVRLAHTDLTPFSVDQARDAFVADDVYESGE